jgi:opacity protein-like surface antigen
VNVLRFAVGLLLSVLPVSALAQSVSGPYASGAVGAAIPGGSLTSIGSNTRMDLDTGFSGAVTGGWAFGNGLRAELQGGYQSNGISDINTRRNNGNLAPLGSVDGHLSTWSAMANVIYDLPVRRYFGPLRPYVGAGVGYGWLDFNGAGGKGFGTFHLPLNNIFTGPDIVRFGSGGAFAYQAIAGVAYPLRRMPGVRLTAEYRFFGTARADVPVTRVVTGGILVNGAVPGSFTHNGFMAADNILMVGLRYNFGGR